MWNAHLITPIEDRAPRARTFAALVATITVENTVRDLRLRGALSPCLVLRTSATGKMRAERLSQLGVTGVLPKRDPARVLAEVEKTVG